MLFVPFALSDHDQYQRIVNEAFEPLGIEVDSLHRFENRQQAVRDAEAIFIGGGNSFRLLKTLYDSDLIDVIRQRVLEDGVPYMGSSAGTNMSCPTIRTTNDMPIVEPPSLSALGLIPFNINPHYLDPDPSSTHKGETREKRIAEFHEENTVPVLGIREGSWLKISGDHCELGGLKPARLFRRGQEPVEIPIGDDLSFLLQS